MEEVASIVAYQDKHYDGSDGPPDQRKGDEIPLGARILKLALDFDALQASGKTTREALTELSGRAGYYDPSLVTALLLAHTKPSEDKRLEIRVWELRPNMVLAEDVSNMKGVLVLAKGQEVTEVTILRLLQLAEQGLIDENIAVVTPAHLCASD